MPLFLYHCLFDVLLLIVSALKTGSYFGSYIVFSAVKDFSSFTSVVFTAHPENILNSCFLVLLFLFPSQHHWKRERGLRWCISEQKISLSRTKLLAGQ